MRSFIAGILLAWASLSSANVAPPQSKLLVVLQGKGTNLGWELGVLTALQHRLPAIEQGNYILSANSGGAVLAAWFACRGITRESLEGAQRMLNTFERSLVHEDAVAKLRDYMAGKESSYEHSNLDVPLAEISNGGKCAPTRPTIIGASNADIADNRKNGFFNEKVLTLHDYLVSDSKGKPLGKACTYFVDPSLYKVLATIPYAERLCDLRPMTTWEDLRVAVLASVSEPTYFPWMKEPHPELIGGFDDPKKRVESRFYNGGFPLPVLAQDIRRVIDTVAIGTGRPDFDSIQKLALRKWYALKLGEAIALGKWWLDIEVLPPAVVWDRMKLRFKGEDELALKIEEFNQGREHTERCLTSDDCLPAPFQKPVFNYAVGDVSKTPLPTQRGRAALERL